MYEQLTPHVCSVPLCGIVFVHLSHTFSGPKPWLECVHASVQVCIYTWFSMSAPLPLHSYMENKGAQMYYCVCPCHASSGPTPWFECVHGISTCMQVPLTSNGCPTSLQLCTNTGNPSTGPTPWSECVHASVHVCAGETTLSEGETPQTGGERPLNGGETSNWM